MGSVIVCLLMLRDCQHSVSLETLLTAVFWKFGLTACLLGLKKIDRVFTGNFIWKNKCLGLLRGVDFLCLQPLAPAAWVAAEPPRESAWKKAVGCGGAMTICRGVSDKAPWAGAWPVVFLHQKAYFLRKKGPSRRGPPKIRPPALLGFTETNQSATLFYSSHKGLT